MQVEVQAVAPEQVKADPAVQDAYLGGFA